MRAILPRYSDLIALGSRGSGTPDAIDGCAIGDGGDDVKNLPHRSARLQCVDSFLGRRTQEVEGDRREGAADEA